MDEAQKYNKYKHQQTNLCWCIINIVLNIAYLIEVIKGLRDVEYFITFCVVNWSPWIIFNICRRWLKVPDFTLEYVAGIGYLFFYIFVMATSSTMMTFCYIFPMLTILTVYANNVLNTVVMSLAVAINLGASLARLSLYSEQTVALDVTNVEIQIACILLCTVFLWRSSKILLLKDSMIESLANAAYFDVLTKIHNRLYLTIVTKYNIENNKHISSLAIIDIDKFKDINDKYGHQSGDDALIKVAELLISVTKPLPNTTPIRLGGDEFIIISSGATSEELYIACIKLRHKLQTNKVKSANGDIIPLTVSIGVINGYKGAEFTDLYEPCDKLLYDAKENGRNAITVCNDYMP